MSALTHTEMGLQVHSASASAANREHRQPEGIRPAGRNRFAAEVTEPDVQIVPPRPKAVLPDIVREKRWEDTFVSATEAAHYLGYEDFRDLRKYVAAGLLTPHYRPLSNRAIYRRAEVEALVKPRAA